MGRYLVGQKLSDYQIEKILKSYAERLLPSATLRTLSTRPTRATNTVYEIYALVRRRLRVIGYFPDSVDYETWLDTTGAGYSFTSSRTSREIEKLRVRLHGIASHEARHDRLSEVYFLAEHPDYSSGALFSDIKLAVKVTGPLNRPPHSLNIWHEYNYALTVQRMIADHRRWLNEGRAKADKWLFNPDFHLESIATYELMIAESQKRLRAKLRARDRKAAAKQSRP